MASIALKKKLQRILKRIKPFVVEKIKTYRKDASVQRDYFREFLESYDPSRNTAALWKFSKSKRFYYSEFFADDQAVFLNSVRQFRKLPVPLNLKNTTFFVKGDKPAFFVERTAQKTGVPVCYLKKGLIGLPQNAAMQACFLIETQFDPATGKRVKYAKSMLNDCPLSEAFVAEAARLRRIYTGLGIGSGQTPSFIHTKKLLGPRLKKRVLVLPAPLPSYRKFFRRGYNAAALLELAARENPDADVYLYNTRLRRHKLVQSTRRVDGKPFHYSVVPGTVRSTDMIRECDQIYTNHALGAVDAIFYDKKLTVTGRPLYAGRGLTDDRAKRFENRNRALSADELFGILFLKCTKYAYGNGDAVTGLLSTMFEAAGHFEGKTAQSVVQAGTAPEPLAALCQSEHWPVLLDFLKDGKPGKPHLDALKWGLDLESAYIAGSRFNRPVAAAFIGVTAGKPHFKAIILSLKRRVPLRDMIPVLQQFLHLSLSPDGLKEIEAFLEEQKEWENSREMLEHLLQRAEDRPTPSDFSPPAREGKEDFFVKEENLDTELRLARVLKAQKRLDEAEEAFYRLLLSGFPLREIFFHLAEIAVSKFCYRDAVGLFKIAFLLENPGYYPMSTKQRARAAYVIGDETAFVKAMSSSLLGDPSSIAHVIVSKGLLDDRFGPFPYEEAFFNVCNNRLSPLPKTEANVLAISKAYMICERYEGQIAMLERMHAPKQRMAHCVLLMDAYMFSGQTEKARQLAEEMLYHYPTIPVFQEAVKLAIRTDDYDWADRLFAQAEERGLQRTGVVISEMLYRKYSFGKQNVREAYASFRSMSQCDYLRECFGDKYFQSAPDCAADSVLVVACFGPGDETRFASLYPRMETLFPGKKVTFTCEPRLFDLYRRSYPQLDFIPVARLRSLNYKIDLDKYRSLPFSELYSFFDNEGYEAAERHGAVTLTTDLLGDVILDKDSLDGRSYLVPSEHKRQFWANRIRSNRVKIGLSWRSSLVTYQRTEHYLSAQDLKPLLDAFDDRVEFFNLQYDNADAEMAWFAKNCRRSLTHFEDLDQYNDLDSVAAFMCCMDLIIAPATTAVEMAGGLGCPTLLLSNSSELHWRKSADGTMADVWHGSVRHVEGAVLGDKRTLVESLIEAVRAFLAAGETERATERGAVR
jgi:capsular polysaccharide export protein